MKVTLDVDELFSGNDRQRIETWAVMAGMSVVDYISACVRGGHHELKAEVSESALYPSPRTDDTAVQR